MTAFIAWLRRLLGSAEHADIDTIMRPLTRIKEALIDLHHASSAAAEDHHDEADALRDRAHDFEDKAREALRTAAKLYAIFGDGPDTNAGAVEGGIPPSEANTSGASALSPVATLAAGTALVTAATFRG